MTANDSPIQSIKHSISQLLTVMDMMEQVPGLSDPGLSTFKSQCETIPGLLNSGKIKVAVVGVIKSGKSTFINALAGKELVKRGAGVVTSITTRITKGKKNRAVITLKSWDEINAVLSKALEMFPEKIPSPAPSNTGMPHPKDFETDYGDGGLDIRRSSDRQFLRQVYDKIVQDFPITDQGIRPEALVLKNALEGYEFLKDKTGADPVCLEFSGKDFEFHQGFTGDPARAFYVKDVCLEIFGKIIEPNIELADCQGADSTDPGQLSQILRYIESANFIVYCISSRNGLRQADMEFLRLIKKLGLLENILFLNNCDLSEHENLADLKAIESKILNELRFFLPHPRLYSFSALYDLFAAMEQRLTPKNRLRFDAWQGEDQMVSFCSENSQKFREQFNKALAGQHFYLVFASHRSRLLSMAGAMDKTAGMALQMVRAKAPDQDKARQRVTRIREDGLRLRTIADNSVEGAVAGLENQIRADLGNIFFKDAMNIRKKTRDFIRMTPIDPSPYRHLLRESGFRHILYLMFQDFKRKLDLFAVANILPDIKKMVQEQEKRVETYFQSLLDSYKIDLLKGKQILDQGPVPVNTVAPQNNAPHGNTVGDRETEKASGEAETIDMATIKKILGLELPETLFSPVYTPKVKAGAMTGLGIQSVLMLVASFLNKNTTFSFTPGFNRAAAVIKKESQNLVGQQIEQYYHVLLNQYFIPLIQAATRDFKEKIHDRFSLYDSLKEDMDRILALHETEKERQEENILAIRATLASVTQTLEAMGS